MDADKEKAEKASNSVDPEECSVAAAVSIENEENPTGRKDAKMIPRKIHYCWVGGNPLTPLAEKCIASWRKFCPGYEIIRWDESNYDFFKHPYMKQAYEAKKWGFVPDYARLDIIHQHGGIYLDTDVEAIKPLDSLLQHRFYAGFESSQSVALGLGFGAEPGHPLLEAMLRDYDNYSFFNADGTLNQLPSPQIQTALLRQYGLQDDTGAVQRLEDGAVVYPVNYFAPRNEARLPAALPEAYSIHHYAASWCDDQKRRRLRNMLKKLIFGIFGQHSAWIVSLKRKIFH